MLTLQAIPLNKKGPFNNISDWNKFKTKSINEFGSIDIFGRDVNKIFDLLPRYKSVQEVANNLSPKIKTLQANLEIMQQFHNVEDLHSVALTQHLILNIMRSLPLELRSSFNDKFMTFSNQDPSNVRPPATFTFLAQFVSRTEKNYRSNPALFDLNFSLANVSIKAIRPVKPSTKSKPPRHSSSNNPPPPSRPCIMCTVKDFQSDHYPLNRDCGVGKLGSPDILKIISNNNLCPTCTYSHDPAYKCKQAFFNRKPKVCTKGCMHDGIPVHIRACMHSNHTPTFTMSKVGINKSVPLVENVPLGSFSLGIQYDTGCQLSLISQSALQAIPKSMYS